MVIDNMRCRFVTCITYEQTKISAHNKTSLYRWKYSKEASAASTAKRTRTTHQGTRHNQKRRMKVSPMNLGYISFMIASVLVVCVVLMGYINLQSDITNRVTHISKMESELNNLKLANDETYTKIMSNVDLDEIKRIAIGELGMKYAKEGQVITYSGEGSDYVRQYGDIPE